MLDPSLIAVGIQGEAWEARHQQEVRDYTMILRRARRLSAPRLARSVIGYVDNDAELPYELVLLSFTPLKATGEHPRILIVGGVHGHEIAGAEAALKFAEELAKRPTRYSELEIDVIPVLNPWGWEHGSRYNSGGMDINRDFGSSRTVEAGLFRSFIRRSMPYDLVIDLHETYKSGYFLYDYSFPPDRHVWNTYRAIIGLSDKPLENDYRESMYRTNNGILRISRLPAHLNRLSGRLSLDGFMALRRTKRLYVIETPLGDTFIDRLRLQLRTIHAIIAEYQT